MLKQFVWRILVVLTLVLGLFTNVESVSALGTPEIVSISPPSGSQVGSNVCIRARVAWDADFRSMRIRFGNEGWNESAEIEFERCFGTGHLAAGWYTIRVEVAKVNEDWNSATATETGYELTAPPPPAGPSRGPNISVFSFSPESATVGDNVNIHIRVDSSNPGATTITVGCGNLTKNETSEVEFDSNWNTSSCGDGNSNIRVCSRATDDPNWSNASCTDRNYYLAPKQVSVPAPTANLWVDSDNIITGSCTYLHWSSSNANSAEIDGESVNLNGDLQVCPPVTKKYSFVVHGAGGDSSRNLTVVVSGSPQSPNVADYFSTKDLININGNLFVIVNGEKRHIPNPETLDALGISRGMIDNKGFSASDLNKIPTGQDIPDVSRDKAGFDAFKARYFANLAPIVPNQNSATTVPLITGGQVQVIPNGPQGLASDGECPASPTVLSVGGQAEIAGRDLNLRPRPNVDTDPLTIIPNFAQVIVVDGPRCKQEVRWFMVEYKGVQGWAAEVGTGGEYHMYPVVVDIQPTPTVVPQVEVPLIDQGLVSEERIEGTPLAQCPMPPPTEEPSLFEQWFGVQAADNRFTEGQCTWYVYAQRPDVKGWIPDAGADAYTWDDSATNKDLVVNHNPVAGDIVVFEKSCGGAYSDYGHVAYVKSVFEENGKLYITVDEANRDGKGTVTLGSKYAVRDANCMKFIHSPTGSPTQGEDNEQPANDQPQTPDTTLWDTFVNWLSSLFKK